MNPLVIVALIGLAVLGSFAGLQTVRLAGCKSDVAAQEARATVMAGQIEEQNRAVQGLVQTALDKAKRAATALQAVQTAQRSHEAEKQRLEALLASAKVPQALGEPARTCGQAWAEIRSGK